MPTREFMCDWPGCKIHETIKRIDSIEARSWGYHGDLHLHLCPLHKRKTWAELQKAIEIWEKTNGA